MKSDADIRAGLDGIQADMAAHQRIVGKEVTAEANRELATETFQELAQRWADEPEMPAAATARASAAETRAVDLDGRKYTLELAPVDDVKFRQATPVEAYELPRLDARVQVLLAAQESGPLGQPSYRTRLLAITSIMTRAIGLARAGLVREAEATELRFRSELVALCDESDRHFGPWRAERPLTVEAG